MKKIILIAFIFCGCGNKEVDLIKQETAAIMKNFKILQEQNEINTKVKRAEIDSLERALNLWEAKGVSSYIILTTVQDIANAKVALSLENFEGLKVGQESIKDLQTTYQDVLNSIKNIPDKEKIIALQEKAAEIKSELDFKENIYREYYDNINEQKIIIEKMNKLTENNIYETKKNNLEAKILLER